MIIIITTTNFPLFILSSPLTPSPHPSYAAHHAKNPLPTNREKSSPATSSSCGNNCSFNYIVTKLDTPLSEKTLETKWTRVHPAAVETVRCSNCTSWSDRLGSQPSAMGSSSQIRPWLVVVVVVADYGLLNMFNLALRIINVAALSLQDKILSSIIRFPSYLCFRMLWMFLKAIRDKNYLAAAII